MIIGFHLTWTTYGHWFPNDPRGSWSDEVWKPELARIRALDDARKVTRPRPVSEGGMQHFLRQARSELKQSPVQLAESEICVVAAAFAEVAASAGLEILACAILSNHVHVAVERHFEPYERIVDRLKGRSSQRVRESRHLPRALERRQRVPIWTQGYWVRYVNSPEQMEYAVRYVRNNPVREGRPLQDWGFVCTDYE